MATNAVYNRISEKYHETVQKNFYNASLEVPAMLRLLRKKDVAGKRVLDVGCGSGRYTKILLDYGAKVCGVDPSENLLKIARKENPSVEFKVGELYKIPYKSNSFDAVVAGLVVEYVDDLNRAFKEVNRTLKKGGIFIFSKHNPVTEIAEHDKCGENNYKFNNYFKEGFRKIYWPTFGVTMTQYHATLETVIKALVRNNFTIEDYVDAKPVPESKKLFPQQYQSTINKPYFCMFKVRKTA